MKLCKLFISRIALVLVLSISLITYPVYAQGNDVCLPDAHPLNDLNIKEIPDLFKTENQNNRVKNTHYQILRLTVDTLEKDLPKLREASPTTLIVVDDGILNNKSALDTLKTSPARLVFHSNSGAHRTMPTILEQPILGSPEIIALLPNDANGVQKVFGKINDPAIVNTTLNQMERTKTTLNTLENFQLSIETSRENTSIAKQIELEASSKENDMLIIIGHNDNGVLKAPDGSSVNINNVFKLLKESKRPALILSCETINKSLSPDGVMTTRRLKFEEIAAALKMVDVKIGDYVEPKLSDYIVELENGLRSSEVNTGKASKVILSIALGTLVVLVVVLVVDDGDD